MSDAGVLWRQFRSDVIRASADELEREIMEGDMSEESVTYVAGEVRVQVDGVREPLVVEGELTMVPYYNSDDVSVEVDGCGLTSLLVDHGVGTLNWSALNTARREGRAGLGRVRITIEWLD